MSQGCIFTGILASKMTRNHQTPEEIIVRPTTLCHCDEAKSIFCLIQGYFMSEEETYSLCMVITNLSREITPVKDTNSVSHKQNSCDRNKYNWLKTSKPVKFRKIRNHMVSGEIISKISGWHETGNFILPCSVRSFPCFIMWLSWANVIYISTFPL